MIEHDDDSPTLEGAALLITIGVGGLWIALGLLAWWWLR
jgi:hypothetical protein